MNTTEENTFNKVNIQIQTKKQPKYIKINHLSQSYVPFLNQAKRFNTQKSFLKPPPIGTYNIRGCFDSNSYLDEKVKIILMKTRKQQFKMNIFKSTSSRFRQIIKETPGPASYNTQKRSSVSQKRLNTNWNMKLSILKQKSTCPSIPDKKTPFGYAVQNGKFKKINKGLQQLQRQKIAKKIYTSTLSGQKSFLSSHSQRKQRLSQDSNLIRKKLLETTKNLIQLRQNQPEKKQEYKNIIILKPKYHHLYNSKGIQSPDIQRNLGPGCYNSNNQSPKLIKNKQKFQFFGSSQIRFKQNTKNLQQKGYSLLEMIKQNKNIKQDTKQKKNHIKMHNCKNVEKQKKLLPGPGFYDPNQDLLKKSRGSTVFPIQKRFKQPKNYSIQNSINIENKHNYSSKQKQWLVQGCKKHTQSCLQINDINNKQNIVSNNISRIQKIVKNQNKFKKYNDLKKQKDQIYICNWRNSEILQNITNVNKLQ